MTILSLSRYDLLLPNQEDKEALLQHMSILVARSWVAYVPWLEKYGGTIPKYIDHAHKHDTKRKTKAVSAVVK